MNSVEYIINNLKDLHKKFVQSNIRYEFFPNLKSHLIEITPKEFYDSLEYIRRTGNVLNQIATRMHYLGYVEDMNILRKTVTDLNNLVLNIKEYYLLPEKTDKDNAN